tara:strand:+ start:1164 stop:1472 length:309 start_codon:yes stop_codon:yes gene_type:complete
MVRRKTKRRLNTRRRKIYKRNTKRRYKSRRRRGGMLQGISPPMNIPKTRNEPREPRRQVVGSRSNEEIIIKLERDNQELRDKLNDCVMEKNIYEDEKANLNT